jgi:hypothetical protein
MESYAKYADMPRVQTCLLIDEPPVVVMGRTFSELVASVVVFLGFAYLDMVWVALLAAIAVGGLVPLLRIRYPRGFLVHFAWSLGLVFPEVSMFTLGKTTHVLGP